LNIPEKEIAIREKVLSNASRLIRVEGTYATYEGLVFADSWNPEKQVIAPFDIPKHWELYRGLDYGYSKEHPFAVAWLARNPETNKWYLYREYSAGGSEKTTGENAVDIKRLSEGEEYVITVDDPKGGARRRDMMAHGIDMVAGKADPHARNDVVAELLKMGRLFIFNTCTHFIDNMNRFSWAKITANSTLPKKDPRYIYNDMIDAAGYVLLRVCANFPMDEDVLPEQENRTEYQIILDMYWKRELELAEKRSEEAALYDEDAEPEVAGFEDFESFIEEEGCYGL
jgi:phage terminase large subunit